MPSSETISWIVYGAISGIFALVTGAIGVVTCVRVRRHGDPARLSMPWLKLTLLLTFL